MNFLLCEARWVSFEESLLYASDYWSQGFTATLKQKKPNWRLNSELQRYYDEVMSMAKKAITKGSNYAKSDSATVQWVNVSLSDIDVEQIDGWLAGEPDLLVEYVRLVSSGFAVGCKPANNGDGFMATIIGEGGSDRGGTYGISAYAATPISALGVVLFKFVSKLDGSFANATIQSRNKYR